jgi:peptidyl-prolyl cis-trans isomerase SurA
MRTSFYTTVLCFALAVVWVGCKTTRQPQQQETVLQTLGSHPLHVSEFAYVYHKNNSSNENAYTRESLNEYLELYTNFKLKVLEAQSRGLDTTYAFRRELDGYKEQLAQPYLTEKSVSEKLVREAYDRLHKEVNASHILITVGPDAEPKDSLAAYQKILKIREDILKGADFGIMAKTHSQDPSAAENKGHLGYFTALQMVYPFEDAAYRTPVGEVSQPVRTRFGYHLIKVHDLREAQGEVKVAHILIRANPGMPKADSAAAKLRVDEIYRRVQRQEDWNKLAAQFSEDAASANNGGELPWFGMGRLIPSFEEAAFALQEPGAVSAPTYTPYGWHIIKLHDRRKILSYEEMEPSLRQKVAKDSRSELNKAAFLKRIRQENQLEEFKPAKDLALSHADSSLLKGSWDYQENDKIAKTTLFSIQNRKYPVADFFTYAKANQRPRTNSSPTHAMHLLYDKFLENSLLQYERENLENKHEDYRMLVKEYRDGILLFQLMDEKVWSKAIEDSVGLQRYFNQNREKYKWDTRAQATIISAASRAVLEQALTLMKKGHYPVMRSKPEDVLFEVSQDNITAAAVGQLNELTQRMLNDPTLTLEVKGHHEATEATALANQRAQKVAAYLVQKGVPATRITTTSLGKTQPATTGKTAVDRRRNRRVSLDLYSTELRVLEENLNSKNPLALKITTKKFQKGENSILDQVPWQEGTHTLEKDGRMYHIIIENILPSTYKNLNETRGIATSDYQTYLEQEWIKRLRAQYPVTVNQQELEKLIRK